MATLTKPDIDALTVDERLKLIDDLWNSIEESAAGAVPPDWHREVLDEILDEEERNPQPTTGWPELKAEMEAKWIR